MHRNSERRLPAEKSRARTRLPSPLPPSRLHPISPYRRRRRHRRRRRSVFNKIVEIPFADRVRDEGYRSDVSKKHQSRAAAAAAGASGGRLVTASPVLWGSGVVEGVDGGRTEASGRHLIGIRILLWPPLLSSKRRPFPPALRHVTSPRRRLSVPPPPPIFGVLSRYNGMINLKMKAKKNPRSKTGKDEKPTWKTKNRHGRGKTARGNPAGDRLMTTVFFSLSLFRYPSDFT